MEKPLDHRVKMTKLMLRRGLIDLLERKQLREINVTELCKQSGINRGTFYAHYKDIGDLNRSIEEEVFSEIQKTLESHPLNLTGKTAFKEQTIYYAIFQFFHKSSDLRSLLIHSEAYTPLLQKLLALGFEKFQREYKKLRPGQDEDKIRCTFNFIAAGIISFLREWTTGGCKEPVEVMARRTEQLATACIRV